MIINYHKEEYFDLDIYKNKYKDLSLFLKSDLDYLNHWKKIGHVKRNMIKNDWKLYLSINYHLVENGICEQDKIDPNVYQDLSVDFNPAIYLKLNHDLQKIFSEENVIDHWINYGVNEGRTCF